MVKATAATRLMWLSRLAPATRPSRKHLTSVRSQPPFAPSGVLGLPFPLPVAVGIIHNG